MAGGTVDAELGRHFVAPLPDQGGRGEDQDPFGHAAQDVFLQHHPRLDRLAKPDLVGQQHPAAILLQHLADGLDLIPMRLHPLQRRQAEKLVEPLEQAQPHKFAAQVERDGVAVRIGAGDIDGVGIGEIERHVEPRLQPWQIRHRWPPRVITDDQAPVRAWRVRPGADEGACGGLRNDGRPPRSVPGRCAAAPSGFRAGGVQPVLHDVVADEPGPCGTVGIQLLRLQHRPGSGEVPLLGEGEGGEQRYRLAWHIALAVALQEDQRSLR